MARLPRIIILDNNGKTFDRYTIIDTKTADVWGASDNPFHPQGFGQYSHNIADSYWRVAYGTNWRNRIKEQAAIKDAVNKYLNDDLSHIGVRVELNSLPEMVQKYIKQIIE